MTHALHDPVRHNAWATTQILEFCQGLDEQKTQCADPRKSGCDVHRMAPFELRAHRCSGNRHSNGYRNCGPNQDEPSQSHFL